MAKEKVVEGLSNSLIGKRIVPKYYEPGQMNVPMKGPWPTEFKANLNEEHVAEIMAVWTQEGQVKIAAIDPHGNTGETYLVNVKIWTK